jgi:hypothetical protein
MGTETLSKSLLRRALRYHGLTAARLDYHAETGALFLTIRRQNAGVSSLRIPLGKTFSSEQICELLIGPAAPPPPG